MSLLERIRQVTTIGDNYPVYKEASIYIRQFNPDDVKPISKYVLRDNLHRLNQLRQRVDIFNLEDLIEIDGFVIGPPIIENDGQVDCIVDGLHRFTIAKVKGLTVKAIYIEGSGRQMIGYPISWQQLSIRRDRPQQAIECRDLRVCDDPIILRQHYRDFSFMGSMGRRPRHGQSG